MDVRGRKEKKKGEGKERKKKKTNTEAMKLLSAPSLLCFSSTQPGRTSQPPERETSTTGVVISERAFQMRTTPGPRSRPRPAADPPSRSSPLSPPSLHHVLPAGEPHAWHTVTAKREGGGEDLEEVGGGGRVGHPMRVSLGQGGGVEGVIW